MDKLRDDTRQIPFSSDECPNSADDSDEDVITDYLDQCEGPPMAHKPGDPGGPLVPTISVTPHSPGTKSYPILEDNLQHLHEIHESIQQMRDHSVQAANIQVLGLAQYSRLSASCPSLNDPGSDPDLLASLNSSPMHNTPTFMAPTLGDSLNSTGNSKEWLMCRVGDASRRRSWTALEDLTNGGEKRKSNRQRSMSLSSLDDSEPELEPADSVGSSGLLVTDSNSAGVRRPTRGMGGASTHSLNEADLQSDFNKIMAKREAERLLPARLPLQKSVSTPSILAVRDIANPVVIDGAEPAPPISTAYDHHSAKRRKRGSIFFRKKKDKDKDKGKKSPHQWVSACYGSLHSCDWCSKPLTNKPALYCENCLKTVHQNSCKDHILECIKPKMTKNTSKGTGFPVGMSSSKLPGGKRGSTTLQSHSQSSNSQIINEEKEGDGSHHEGSNISDDLQFEFYFEGNITANDLETDPFLGLQDEEPDSWTPTVSKEITKKLKEKEIKRQEHIYEFILTEKHHCLTLRVMQKVFVEGLRKHFQLGNDLDRMFPRLLDLTEIHLNFLQRLRERQREAPVVETLTDILLEQFSGDGSKNLKAAYGEFCSQHRRAVDIYKSYLQDRRFAEFVRHCQANPLLKKKGIPECILFVTQRLTKYPLLIEPLIKTAKDNKVEQEKLGRALGLVKEILVEVDAQVAEKEKEDRKFEIYNRVDAKSYTIHRGNKFRKSDILLKNRRLRFEGVAMLMQGRSKMQLVLVIVLSDVLFFLLESNHKYTFFTPDNKTGVVSLQKLLVREKAGQESRGIYLISSNPADPEMFELKVHKPKDKLIWIQAVRKAVQSCQEDEDEGVVLSTEDRQKLLDAKQQQIKQIVGSSLGFEGVLRQKDVEQAQILEEKMALQQKLLAAAGVENIALEPPPSYCNLVSEDTDSSALWQKVLSAVHEVNMLASSLYAPGTNLSRSVSSVGEHQSQAYISPTLPKRAETFGGFDNANKDQLPKTIAKGVVKKHQPKENLDQSNSSTPVGTPDSEANSGTRSDARPQLPLEQLPWRSAVMATIPPGVLASNLCDNSCELPALLMLDKEQQLAAVQLSHYVYYLLAIISQQMTAIHSLQGKLSASRTRLEEDSRERRPVYRHNQQLEELRNLQDKLSQEKEAWQREREMSDKYIEDKKSDLQRQQEQIRAEQRDIEQQREQLYRKMELLTFQGILISPNLPMVTPGATQVEEGTAESHPLPSTDSTNPSPPDSRRKQDPKWKAGPNKPTLPLNLISATNQQKVPQSMQVKQQLPLKLANKLGCGGVGGSIQQMLPLKLSQTADSRRSSGSGYQRLGNMSPPTEHSHHQQPSPSHARTGSSPAMMQNASPDNSPTGSKAGRTNTYPRLPDKFRVKSPDSAQASPSSHPMQPSEEEVIFF